MYDFRKLRRKSAPAVTCRSRRTIVFNLARTRGLINNYYGDCKRNKKKIKT